MATTSWSKCGSPCHQPWAGTHAQDRHSATADDGSFDSGVKQGSGTTWEHRFTTPGEIPYSCTPHPFMTGTITVT